MERRALLIAAASLALTAYTLPTAAAGLARYEAGAFETALKSGPVVVHVHADWCPVCRKQQPALSTLSSDPAMTDVKFIAVNFDKDKTFLKRNKVANQSVILIFKGGKEVARLIGTTDPAAIRAGVTKALA